MTGVPIVLFCIAVVLLFLIRFRRMPSRGFSGDDSKLAMQILVSIAILGTSLYIILSGRYTPQDQHWAYASAGTILGYWLKG